MTPLQALVRCTALETLDLSDTTIGPEAGATLGAMLRTNTSLRVLNLSGTSLGSAGVIKCDLCDCREAAAEQGVLGIRQ